MIDSSGTKHMTMSKIFLKNSCLLKIRKSESGMVAISLQMEKGFLQSKHVQVQKQLQMFFAWYWLKFVEYWSANR